MRLALLVLTLLLAACTQPAPVVTSDEVETTPEPQIAQETNFAATLILHEFSITPETLTVPHGSSVQLTIENVGDVTHGLGMMDFNVNEHVGPGETKTITFIADKKGAFSFFCSVPCGSGHNSMRGKLIVE